MGKRILTMCPTRGRPSTLRDMLDSWAETRSPGTDMAVYLNTDDPKFAEYAHVVQGRYINVLMGSRLYLAQAYNHLCREFPGYDYYAPVNDDHFFITTAWDAELVGIVEREGNGWGMAAAEDNLTEWAAYQHPSGCVLSGNIVRALGHMIWPKFQHIGIDDYFQHLLQALNMLWHTKDVVIEHRHWINGKRMLDANYKWVYGQEQQIYGRAAVQEYLGAQLWNDVRTIQEAMRSGGR